MFKSLGNSNSIPNNYVYTSHRGTEYMYLDGSWMNCETMQVVENKHNFKMNQSAKAQIAEHNENNSLQIGGKYGINESTYTYVGRNNFTINGNLLSESMNTKVQQLVEADASDENPDAGSSSDVPNGYVYSSNSGKKYFKKNGQWFSVETKKPINSSSAVPLERAAQAQIAKFNSESPIKIGQEWKSKKGITYKYAGGNRWISDSGKMLPASTAEALNQQLSSTSSDDEAPADQGSNDSSGSQDQGQDQSSDTNPPSGNPAGGNSGDNSNSGGDPLQGLANEIKSNPYARKIIVLLSRGDEVSLLAADILLSGSEKKAVEILNSLNNTD